MMAQPASRTSAAPQKRLLVVSNRLPVSIKKDDEGHLTAAPSSGGLVSALNPILSEHGGTWVGSTGIASTGEAHNAEVRRVLATATRGTSVRYLPVFLSGEEHINFYEGFSNEILWPLFHDLQSRCNFAPRYWEFYQIVNQRFGEGLERVSMPAGTAVNKGQIEICGNIGRIDSRRRLIGALRLSKLFQCVKAVAQRIPKPGAIPRVTIERDAREFDTVYRIAGTDQELRGFAHDAPVARILLEGLAKVRQSL